MHINTFGDLRVNPPSFDFARDKEALIYYSIVKIRECLKKKGKENRRNIAVCSLIDRVFHTVRCHCLEKGDPWLAEM